MDVEEKDGLLANAAEPVKEEAPADENLTTTTPPDGSEPVDAPQRPEWLPENFWNKEKGEPNVEGMAKSYAELRKAFNERNNDKPGEEASAYAAEEFFDEEGNFKSETIKIAKDDPALMQAYEAAKEAGLGVKQANAFIDKFLGGMSDFMPEPVDPQAELEKLGENGPAVVSGLKTWVDGMKNNGEINDDVHSAIMELGKTAAGIKALDVLRAKTGEMSLPIGEALSGSSHMSLQEWYSATYETHAEAGESRADFQKRMSDLGRKLIGDGHGTFSGSGFGIGRRS